MSHFHFFVLILLGVTTLIAIILSVKGSQYHITHLSGMITAMFLGMSVGITAGVTFGASYQGDLFLSTILGMSFGILAGFLCGICFGFLSSVEGLMSGLMGGMMGAMLGEMLPVEQANMFIKGFLVLSICTIFLLIILTTSDKATIKNRSWFLKPISTMLMIASVLFFANSLDMEKAQSKTISHDKEHDVHKTSETLEEIKKIVIETADLSYSPYKIVVEKNIPITLELKNSDLMEHDIEIKDLSFNLMSEPSHHHGIKEKVIHLHAEPQTTSEITFSINEVGTYEFYCTIPGHKESGMVGQFVVE